MIVLSPFIFKNLFLPSQSCNIKSSEELGVYSDCTLLRQIKSWVQALQILLEPEADPKEIKAPDGAAAELLVRKS